MQYALRVKKDLIKSCTQKLLQITLATLVLFPTTINTGLAQDITPAEQNESNRLTQQEEIRRRTQQEANERRKREETKDTFLQNKIKQINEITLPTEELSFKIHTLKLEGERVSQFPWVQEILDQYKGQQIGKEGLSVIVKRITNEFIDRGFTTTRIGIPEQDLSSGTLKLTLIPGVIRDIRIVSPDSRAKLYTAFPTWKGNILNLRDLEQGLEQLKRVPSQDVDMKIIPGDKPGESDVFITVKSSNPVRGTFALDDSGTKATGKLQASTAISLDNLLGINDLFYISLNKDADQRGEQYGTRGNSYQYSFPYGYLTFSLSGSSSDYHQKIQGRNQTFVFSGKSNTKELHLQWLIHRDQQSKTSLQFGIIQKNSQSFIDDTEIMPQRKNVTADEVGITHRQYYGKTVVDVAVNHRWGIPGWGAQPEPEESFPDTPTTRYKRWSFDVNVTTPVQFGQVEGRYSFNFRGQYTKDLLYPTDYFSIGNRYTVRGFDGEQTLSAEKGWLIRNEWSMPITKGAEAYLGIDYGQVNGSATQWLLGTKLAGVALGFRGNEGNLSYDVFTSWPIYKPQNYQTSPYALGFQLTYRI